MDVSRLSPVPLARAATSTFRGTQQVASSQAGQGVDGPDPRARTRETYEPVVQGELLHRERTAYQSTRAFIEERTMERAQPAGYRPESLNQSRSAISNYLSNTRPETLSEIAQGKSVNFFV